MFRDQIPQKTPLCPMLTGPDPSEDTRAPDAAFLTLFFPALYPRIFFLNSLSFIFAFIFQSQLTFGGGVEDGSVGKSVLH